MKVVYVYLALIFGGALIAVVYFRAEDKGWPSTIIFFGAIVLTSLYHSRRARKKQQSEKERSTPRARD